MKRPKIVVIGGGTGPQALLKGLVMLGGRERFDITAIVGMADSGGSSGKLRDQFGVLPPGDVIKALIALSRKTEMCELLRHRFPDGHSVGNLLLAEMSQTSGSLPGAISDMERMLGCQGHVFPASLDNVNLVAETTRRKICGEGAIEDFIYNGCLDDSETIRDVFLQPRASLYPEAEIATQRADLVVIGPGSFFTSLRAVLLVEGMAAALARSRIGYVVNITTNPKDTRGWKASDFVSRLENAINRKVDVVICNSTISRELLDKHYQQNSQLVETDLPEDWEGRRVIRGSFVPEDSSLARHDLMRLATVVATLAAG